MGERKVLNKYFPPDFDPSKLAKIPRQREDQWKVRMMLPMSVRCLTCGTYMYKGTKFNTRMETLENENYLGFKIYRFYFKCSNCGAEFTLKTDPEHTDYNVESGAKRNYEPWKAEEQAKDDAIKERQDDIKNDTMKELEYKTKDSKMEMDIMQALDHQKLLNSKTQKIKFEDLLAMVNAQEQQEQGEEEQEDELTEADQARLRELKESGAFQVKSATDRFQIQNNAKQKEQAKRPIEGPKDQQINQNGLQSYKVQKVQDKQNQTATNSDNTEDAKIQIQQQSTHQIQEDVSENSNSSATQPNGLGLSLDYQSD